MKRDFVLYSVFIVLLSHQQTQATDTVLYPKIESVSFSSQVLAINTQMPLALKLEKNSLVGVDAIRKSLLFTSLPSGTLQAESPLSLDTPYSHSVCPARNATIVSFARRPVIQTVYTPSASVATAVDFSQAFQTDQDVLISDIAAAADCSVAYVLDGVQKKIFIVRAGQDEELFVSVGLLVEPTGLYFWEEGEELFIADWGGGAIYSVSVAFASPRVLHRVAGSGLQGMIVDTSEEVDAVLSGPTQFGGFEKGKILFTDRNFL
jgi:hypothetical protein